MAYSIIAITIGFESRLHGLHVTTFLVALLAARFPGVAAMLCAAGRCEASPFFSRPALFGGLPSSSNSERVRGNILGNCRTRRDIRAVANSYRRHQHRIAADEDAIPNGRLVFVDAVIVAGNCTGSDIGLGSELGVADVGKVGNLTAFANHRFFCFHEVSYASAGF